MAGFVEFLAWPFLAAMLFVGMHTWLGLQVLRRKVVFADLALAQLAVLGGTLAAVLGHPPGSLAGVVYALAFTLGGAALLTAGRRLAAAVMPEASVGILYVTAAAATVLAVDRAPQGAEHVKRMLVGNVLTIGPAEVAKLALLYGVVGLVHIAARRKLVAFAGTEPARDGRALLWDFLFYASFALVVTSSVGSAGVLLVFALLIVPAVIGNLFTARIGIALAIGWGSGLVAAATGFAASFVLDLPTGAATVVAFTIVLLVAGSWRWLASGPPARAAVAARAAATAALAVVLVSALWLIAFPTADQPLIAVVEAAPGFDRHPFLSERERDQFADAAESEAHYRAEIEALTEGERAARVRGAGLSDEAVLRLGAFQQTFNEMGRGERFVQDRLRARERARERWYLGIPLALAAALGLVGLRPLSRRPRQR